MFRLILLSPDIKMNRTRTVCLSFLGMIFYKGEQFFVVLCTLHFTSACSFTENFGYVQSCMDNYPTPYPLDNEIWTQKREQI